MLIVSTKDFRKGILMCQSFLQVNLVGEAALTEVDHSLAFLAQGSGFGASQRAQYP